MPLSEPLKEKLLSESSFSTSRGGGPGGQHINKVSTKVELRFHVHSSQCFSGSQKQRLMVRLRNRINKAGELVLTASSQRSQWRNREKVIHKFFNLLDRSLTPPKKRIKTHPTASSRLKRLENKKQLAEKKKLRKPPEI